ncbi:MAG: multiheme c-type cytochrome [Acidobacteriota bacterium]
MTRSSPLSVLSIGFVGLVASLAIAPLSSSQEGAPPPDPAPNTEMPAATGTAAPTAGFYVGVATCASSTCHGSTRPLSNFGVLQNEYYTWLQEDRHAQAYNVLFDERSRIIMRNLRGGRAHESQRCLDCHALTPQPEQAARRLEIEDGITCESCHGPASGWLEGHRSEGWSHADSVAAGMIDLRQPAVRAGVCLDCHLGSADRTVDHELIAAGHPALVFELDNYAAAMPAHWAPAGGRSDPARGDEMLSSHGAAAWAVGQVETLRRGLELIAGRAAAGNWPEFAELSCGDCHHSLAEERWRQPVTDRRRVGLPRWSPARWAVLRPIVSATAPGRLAELDRRMATVSGVVERFGTPPRQVADGARAAAAALAGLDEPLLAGPWDEPRLIALLAKVADPSAPDYDTAAQTLLACNTLVSELIARRPELVESSGLVASLDAMDRAVQSRAAYDPNRFATLTQRFAAEVRELR